MGTLEEASPFGGVVSVGGQRLVLRWIEVPDCPPPKPRWRGWDFHSLVWEVGEGEGWRGHATISKEDLEGDGTDRWFADLHSFDPVVGAAVVKVAEEQPPDAEGQCRVEYSWQKWDLLKKRRSRFLQPCDSPFDGFDLCAGLRRLAADSARSPNRDPADASTRRGTGLADVLTCQIGRSARRCFSTLSDHDDLPAFSGQRHL